jgi:hypothetical protein
MFQILNNIYDNTKINYTLQRYYTIIYLKRWVVYFLEIGIGITNPYMMITWADSLEWHLVFVH